MRILVTGGAGFIGSCLVRQLLERGGDEVVVLDALTYAGNLENLADCASSPRYSFVRGSICDEAVVDSAAEECRVIINVAAETHVDRSIQSPGVFLETNIQGPRVLMDVARKRQCRYVQVSTDEVYGDMDSTARATEDYPLVPSSPYAASKAAADVLVISYCRTYGLDGVITRCGNNYGPRQFPEKLVPLFVTNALEDADLPLYGDGMNVRDWIHVEDHCRGILAALDGGKKGRVYNISAGRTATNREICDLILAALGKPASLIRMVSDRPGHDRRYALDATRIGRELDWRPEVTLGVGLASTVEWYRANKEWWKKVKSGEYLAFYDTLYGNRLKAPGSPSSGSEPER